MHMHMQHPMLRWCMHPKSLGDPETPEGRPRAAPCRAGFPESGVALHTKYKLSCVSAPLLLWYMIIYVEKMCAGDGGTHKHLWKHLNAESNAKTPINNN